MTIKKTPSGIANRLRAARQQAGLSQGQVAKLIGMQRPTISEIEAGRRRVSSDELVQFANLYDVEITWLAVGEVDHENPALELAARELSKLKQDDLDRLLKLLQTLRKSKRER